MKLEQLIRMRDYTESTFNDMISIGHALISDTPLDLGDKLAISRLIESLAIDNDFQSDVIAQHKAGIVELQAELDKATQLLAKMNATGVKTNSLK